MSIPKSNEDQSILKLSSKVIRHVSQNPMLPPHVLRDLRTLGDVLSLPVRNEQANEQFRREYMLLMMQQHLRAKIYYSGTVSIGVPNNTTKQVHFL